MSIPTETTSISFGGGGTFFIDKQNKLWLKIESDDGMIMFVPMSYGTVNKARIDFIIECLGRLRIHAGD